MSEPQEPTHPLLIVTGPPRDGETVALESLGFEKSLGSGADCHLRLQAGNVDINHARIVWEGRGVLLSDLGSAAGTYVNGEKIGTDHILQDGDRICLGPPGSRQSVKLLARIPAESSMPAPIMLAPEQDPFGFGEEPPTLDLGLGAMDATPEPPRAVLMPTTPQAPAPPPPRPAPPPAVAPAPAERAAAAPVPAIIFDTPTPTPKAAPAGAPVPPIPSQPSRPRRPGPDVTELPSIERAKTSEEGAAEPPPEVEEKGMRLPSMPRVPQVSMPSVPPIVWIGLAVALLAGGGVMAWIKLRPPAPVLTALAPSQAEARQTVVLTGTGFDADPKGNTVKIGSSTAEVTAAADTQVKVTVPADVDADRADVPVTIETSAGVSNPVFLRVKKLPRQLKLETDVALPGAEIAMTGQNLEVKPLMVLVAGIPADIVEASSTRVRFRVPTAVPFEEGRSVAITAQVGVDSSPAVQLLLGRLPLISELSPRAGRAGDRVTLRGRGFDAQAAGNVVTFGDQPALVLSATETEMVALVPHVRAAGGQLEVPVAVKARGSASAGSRLFAVQTPSAAVFVPHFFAVPVPEDPSGERVFVSTALGPVLLLSGRADAPSAAERGARSAAALNTAFAAKAALEIREAPAAAMIAARGRPEVIALATAADAAAYAPPIVPAGAARVGARALAGHWLAMLQDMQALFVDRQRPVHVVQSSPRGKILLDLYAEAERVGGAGAGVPTRLVDPLPLAIERGFREMALVVPAPGQTSAAAAVTGVWRGTLEEDGVGQRTMQLRVQMNGTRLAGAITSSSGKVGMEIPVLDLAYDKGVLSFRTTSGAAARRYRATLEGATLAGTIHAVNASEPVVGRFKLRYTE